MQPTRRDFLRQSIAAAVATQATNQQKVVARSGGDLLTRMSWLNPPALEHYSDGTLNARSRGKTDFWRKTYYGYINDNGHFLNLPVAGEFKFTARVEGNYSALYDQAGLMVRLDEKHWMKCGSEFFDGKRWASVVFTHDFSDWSTMDDLTQVGPVWWRVVRTRDSLEAQCSKDGDKFVTVRQGYFPAGPEVKVGVMFAAPEGPGFDCVFDQISIEGA
jgi:regulation of enolase protein 1 (concanavalin A-like superfamily)